MIAGLLVWLPLAATVVIIKLVINLLDKIILILPLKYQPESLFGFYIPGFGLLLALGVLVLTGMLAANLLGRELVAVWESILSRIPVVRSIYNAVKQIVDTVLTSKGKSFRKVVMAEYPRKGIWAIGFVSIKAKGEVAMRAGTGGDLVGVFVPTTPNPTSGFLLFFPREDVIELDMSLEEAAKLVISAGLVYPGEAAPKEEKGDN